MERLGYQVVNVGERDIRAGYPEFARRTEGTPFTYISANILDRKTQEPVFPRYAVVDAVSTDGTSRVRVGVIGILRYNSVFLKPGPEGKIVIGPPLEGVKAAMADLSKEQVDVVVLLAGMNKTDSKSIAGQVPGIDFVLGSYGGMVTGAAEKVGDTTVLYCGNRGQRIGESRVFFDKDPEGGLRAPLNKLHVLTRSYPADPEMLEFVSTIPKDTRQATPTSSLSVDPSGGSGRPGS